MKQFLPREKMSKRAQRALDRAKRATWEGISPVTRRAESKKTYDRKRSPRWYDDGSTGIFLSGKRSAAARVTRRPRPLRV